MTKTKTSSPVNEMRMKRGDAGSAVLPGPGNGFDALKHDSRLMSEKVFGVGGLLDSTEEAKKET